MKLLLIQIPTIKGREEQLAHLKKWILYQIRSNNIQGVDVAAYSDDKEISIGAKRQFFVENCDYEYMVQIDDDDVVAEDYIVKVVDALKEKPDCVGYLEEVCFDGVKKIAHHSSRWDDWKDNFEGWDYVRTIFCKDVIKTSIVKQIGFKDLRFGEDYDFAQRLHASGLIKKEVFINEVMYYYEGHSLSEEQKKERYGIKD